MPRVGGASKAKVALGNAPGPGTAHGGSSGGGGAEDGAGVGGAPPAHTAAHTTPPAVCDPNALAAAALTSNELSALANLNLNITLPRAAKAYGGFGEGVCTCARCMRRAGPIREDVDNKLVQITYALANVYEDTPDLDRRVTDAHRARAGELMAAVERGDAPALRRLLEGVEGEEDDGLVEPGTASEVATYLVLSSAQLGQAACISVLAEFDADLEEADGVRKGTPLMHAANNGEAPAVRALVECGADVEATDDNGYTALMVAVFSDRASAAEALLQGGAAADALDRAGRSALSYAAMYGSTDCIWLLANHGADVFHADKDGNTPLDLAEDSGRASALEALRKLQVRYKMQEKRRAKAARAGGGGGAFGGGGAPGAWPAPLGGLLAAPLALLAPNAGAPAASWPFAGAAASGGGAQAGGMQQAEAGSGGGIGLFGLPPNRFDLRQGSGALDSQGRLREALRFVFSQEGSLFRAFILDEVVKSVDALSREQLALLVVRLGLGTARVPVLLPGAAVTSLPLAPAVSEEDRRVVENLAKIVDFLSKGGAPGPAPAGGAGGAAAARARADVAAELLPYLPAVAQEVLPELGGQLLSRISARFVREVFIAPRASGAAAR